MAKLVLKQSVKAHGPLVYFPIGSNIQFQFSNIFKIFKLLGLKPFDIASSKLYGLLQGINIKNACKVVRHFI